MLRRCAAVFASLLALAMPVQAQFQAQSPLVVVELYTSQGCHSCPPADVLLEELTQNPSVLPLGLHVDYWDYLGWKDELALPKFKHRQAAFNLQMKSRYRLVTPQMIVQGMDYVAGAKRSKILDYIAMAQVGPASALIDLQREAGGVSIEVRPAAAPVPEAELYLVRFQPEVTVAIKAGENRGRTIRYVNTVTAWESLGLWDGQGPVSLMHSIDGDDAVAVIVQTANLGPVLAAARLD